MCLYLGRFQGWAGFRGHLWAGYMQAMTTRWRWLKNLGLHFWAGVPHVLRFDFNWNWNFDLWPLIRHLFNNWKLLL